MMNERNSIMTKKLSGVVVLLSIVVLLTNGCVYDLLNASIKLDGKEWATAWPFGEGRAVSWTCIKQLGEEDHPSWSGL